MLEYENTERSETFSIFGLKNPAHAQALKKLIFCQKGVIGTDVNFASERMFVRYDKNRTRNEMIIDKAKKIGVFPDAIIGYSCASKISQRFRDMREIPQ
jgi:cation transport ATPase